MDYSTHEIITRRGKRLNHSHLIPKMPISLLALAGQEPNETECTCPHDREVDDERHHDTEDIANVVDDMVPLVCEHHHNCV